MSYHIIEMFKKTEWNDDGTRAVTIYTPEFAFRTREDYLAETASWKAEYKELSKRIRKYKMWRKPRHRPSDIEGYQVYNTLETMQEQARMMLQIRRAAKAEAGRQSVKQKKAA